MIYKSGRADVWDTVGGYGCYLEGSILEYLYPVGPGLIAL